MKLCIAVILLIAIVRNSSARIGGVVYTRWGSSTCPYTSTRVYSGAMAGTSYQFRGGAIQHALHAIQPRLLLHTFWDTRSQLPEWCRICTASTCTLQFSRAQCTLCCVHCLHTKSSPYDSRKNLLSIFVDKRVLWLSHVRERE